LSCNAAVWRLYQEQAAHFGEATNEAQTEEDFMQPVLGETPG